MSSRWAYVWKAAEEFVFVEDLFGLVDGIVYDARGMLRRWDKF